MEDHEMHARLYKHVGQHHGRKDCAWFSEVKVVKDGDAYSVYCGERVEIYDKGGRPFSRHYPKLVCRFRYSA